VTFNSDGSYSYDPSGDQDLDDSESRDITFRYVANDGTADSGEATVTITVNGANDAPVSGGDDSASGSEDDALISGQVPAASDVDVEPLTYSLVSGSVEVDGVPAPDGTVTFNSDGSYSYDPSGDQDLDDSESRDITFRYVANDGTADSGEATVTITVNGADDQPTLAPVTSGSIAEIDQSSATNSSGLSGTLAGSDVDVETLTYGVQGGTVAAGFSTLVDTYGTLSVNISTGAYSFAPDAAAIEGLDVGENPVLNFTFTVSDGDAPLGTQTYTINLTGADDTPTLAPVTSGSVVEVANSSSTIDSGLSGTLVGSDVDVETLTYGIQGGTVSAGFSTLAGTYGTLSVNISTGAYTFTKNVAAIEALNAGQNPSDNFTVTVSDGDAPLGTQTYTVNITGANDGVPPTANDDVWVLSDTAVPSGTITSSWLLNNDTDSVPGPDFFVSSVSGLPAWLTANTVGGHIVSFNVVGAAVAGSYTFTYTLSDGLQTDIGQVTLTVLDTTNSGSDVFTLDGNDFSWVDLQGGADTINGDVILNGNAGTDIFLGNNANDILNGGGGNDQLFGNEADDTLNGDAGDDFLRGDNGNDTLTGGAGNDFFVLNSAQSPNLDTITDYSHVAGNTDLIDITSLLSVASGTNVITGGYLRVTTTGLIQIDTSGGANSWDTVGNVNVSAGLVYNIQYLSGGIATTVTVSQSAPPIALDLDGDGQVSFLGADAGAAFDYGGGTVATAWVAGNDGLLVRDANHDGQVSADEIVFATSGSDLEGLARYDSNGDGQLSDADADFADFGVWQDVDSDGQVDAGELQSLAARSIASISLSSDGVGYSAAGGDVSVVGTGSFTRTDGSTGVLADAVFATGGRVNDEARMVAAASGSNSALIAAAAVAVAGFMAAPAQAETPALANLEHAFLSQSAFQHAPSFVEFGGSGVSLGLAEPGFELAVAIRPFDAGPAVPTFETNHSLIGSEWLEPAELAPLPQAFDAPVQAAVLAAPPMVALPSAAMLAEAVGDLQAAADGNGLLAEMQFEGNQGQAIDALLDAALPHHGGLAVEAAVADVAAAGGMSFGAFGVQHAMLDHFLVAHVDAAQMV
jgi:VCBS repeat-containing protein